MAKTPRAERRANDFYETPKWCTRAILPFLDRRLAGPRILEPAAGAGAICRELVEWFPGAKLDAFDIAPPSDIAKTDIVKADFFELSPRPIYDLVITNPPYAILDTERISR